MTSTVVDLTNFKKTSNCNLPDDAPADAEQAVTDGAPKTSSAAANELKEPAVTKRTVFVRVVFMKLGDIDTVKETFTADVFVQCKWREPRLDGYQNAMDKSSEPVKWDQYWNPKVLIDNALGDPKETTSTILLYDVETWEAFIVERRKIKGTFTEKLELFQFPFDTQDLTVTLISELPDTEVVLVQDPAQMSTINTESFVDEQEWKLYDEVEVFQDNVFKFFQVDSDSDKMHSRFSCRTHASRRYGFYVYSVFLFMCFICSMSFSVFSVDLSKRENRIQMTFILLLTTVTFKFAVNSSLPRISYLTTLDVYILMSLIILILTNIWHSIVFAISTAYNLEVARTADMAVLIILGIIYFCGHVVIGLWVTIRTVRIKDKYKKKELEFAEKLKQQKLRSNRTVALKLYDPKQAVKIRPMENTATAEAATSAAAVDPSDITPTVTAEAPGKSS